MRESESSVWWLQAAEYLADPQTKDLPSGTSLPQETLRMAPCHHVISQLSERKMLHSLFGVYKV